MEVDERISLFWLQTSGTGSSMITTYPPQKIRNIFMERGINDWFAMVKLWNDLLISKSSERYFNKITRNNRGNVK